MLTKITEIALNEESGRALRSTSSQSGEPCQVAECCSVLRCVAACCSVLQSVEVCCSVLQCIAVSCSMLKPEHLDLPSTSQAHPVKWHSGVVCCSELQCVAVCCSVLQCVAARALRST